MAKSKPSSLAEHVLPYHRKHSAKQFKQALALLRNKKTELEGYIAMQDLADSYRDFDIIDISPYIKQAEKMVSGARRAELAQASEVQRNTQAVRRMRAKYQPKYVPQLLDFIEDADVRKQVEEACAELGLKL